MMLKVMDSMALGEVPKGNLRTWFRLVRPDPLASPAWNLWWSQKHIMEYCNVGWIP